MAEDEKVEPGEIYLRELVVQLLGGSNQGGIAPSKQSNSVILYSDPSRGEQHGYRDGWLPDEGDGLVFEYTGHGPSGDQQMWRGNKSIRDQAKDKRPLHLFVACGKRGKRPQEFRYLGEFKVDDAEPYFRREIAEKADRTRKVFVFRLRPTGEHVVVEEDFLPPADKTTVTEWHPRPEVEHAKATSSKQITTEKNTRTKSNRRANDPVEVKRREAELSDRFEAFLLSKGHEVHRFEIRVEGEKGILRTDLCDITDRILYEAKGFAGRDEIRQAIGQLADYRRHTKPPTKRQAILLPEAPTKDLRDLIEAQGFALIYEKLGKFAGWPVVLEDGQ